MLNVEGYQLIEQNIPKGRESQQSWTLTEGYEYSLNVVFAQVATRTLGGAALADYATRFGFGAAVPFDLPTNASMRRRPRRTSSITPLPWRRPASGRGSCSLRRYKWR